MKIWDAAYMATSEIWNVVRAPTYRPDLVEAVQDGILWSDDVCDVWSATEGSRDLETTQETFDDLLEFEINTIRRAAT